MLTDGKAVIVRDKTFEPSGLDEVRLESGESVFWIRDGEGIWISIDTHSDEVILFHDIEEEFDPVQEAQMYMGDEYEFSSEVTAKVLDEDGEEVDSVVYRDFENGNGDMLKIMEFEVTGDVVAAVGAKVTEDDLQTP